MHLTYGYDLKENDDIAASARRTGDLMAQYVLPGAALVNHLPFRRFIYPLLSFQCLTHIFNIQSDASLPGFLYSSMNQLQVNVRSWARG